MPSRIEYPGGIVFARRGPKRTQGGQADGTRARSRGNPGGAEAKKEPAARRATQPRPGEPPREAERSEAGPRGRPPPGGTSDRRERRAPGTGATRPRENRQRGARSRARAPAGARAGQGRAKGGDREPQPSGRGPGAGSEAKAGGGGTARRGGGRGAASREKPTRPKEAAAPAKSAKRRGREAGQRPERARARSEAEPRQPRKPQNSARSPERGEHGEAARETGPPGERPTEGRERKAPGSKRPDLLPRRFRYPSKRKPALATIGRECGRGSDIEKRRGTASGRPIRSRRREPCPRGGIRTRRGAVFAPPERLPSERPRPRRAYLIYGHYSVKCRYEA